MEGIAEEWMLPWEAGRACLATRGEAAGPRDDLESPMFRQSCCLGSGQAYSVCKEGVV